MLTVGFSSPHALAAPVRASGSGAVKHLTPGQTPPATRPSGPPPTSARPTSTAAPVPMGGAVPEWNTFRQLYPYHVQGVAFGPLRANKTRALVVAEPPPGVTLEAIRALDPVLGGVSIRKQLIGHDGWVLDVAGLLPAMSTEDLNLLTSRLNVLLFGTSYKSFAYEIPGGTPRGNAVRLGQQGLDLKISAADLQRWLVDSRRDLVPALGGAPAQLTALIDQPGHSGVYFTADEGLVVWILPNGVDVAQHRFAARQFALDSDLVLGAISGDKATAIIARERALPVTVLPPLRAETIFQLAAARTAGLAQSYERTIAYSGRCDEKHDWAPIYLSQQLIDTEYGSLLNITDQLLKSWSNAGETRYERFLYPNPGRYPFPKALPDHLGVTRVTYNWNTRGAGYGFDGGHYAILALNRTGALPVSYIPGDGAGPEGVMAAEDKAYEYFAGLGDPHLTRVVQYAALYQAFINLKVGSAPPLIRRTPDRANPILLDELVRTYQQLNRANTATLATMAKPLIDENYEALRPKMEAEIRKAEREQNARIPADAKSKFYADQRASLRDFWVPKVEAVRETLRGHVAAAGGDERAGLEKFLQRQEGDADRRAADVLRRMTNLVALRERLVSDSASRARTWIHTPAVVVSWNEGANGLEVVGGHNLDAEISVFSARSSQPRGSIRLEGDKIVFNPADADRVSQVVRDVGRRENDLAKLFPEIERSFNGTAARPIRTVTAALGAPTRATAEVRGLRPVDAPLPPGIKPSWRGGTATPAETSSAVGLEKELNQRVVVVRQEGNEFVAVRGDGGMELRRGGTLDVMYEAIGTEAQADVVHLEGLSEADLHRINLTRKAGGLGEKPPPIFVKDLTPEVARDITAAIKSGEAKLTLLEKRAVAGGEVMSIGVETPRFFAKILCFIKGKFPEAFATRFESLVKGALSKLESKGGVLEMFRSIRGEKGLPAVDMEMRVSPLPSAPGNAAPGTVAPKAKDVLFVRTVWKAARPAA